MCEAMGHLAFLPASIGFMVGILMLLLLDRVIRICIWEVMSRRGMCAGSRRRRCWFWRSHFTISRGHGSRSGICRILAEKKRCITLAAALALSRNRDSELPREDRFPATSSESGMSREKGICDGNTLRYRRADRGACDDRRVPLSERLLPVLLALAAGAMIYVVVEELIPESLGSHSDMGTIGFAVGFVLMMILDVALG